MTDSAAPRLHVQALSADCAEAARRWAERLGLPLAADDEAEFAVQVGEQGLQVLHLGADSPGPVRVDFVEGASAHRRTFGGGSGQSWWATISTLRRCCRRPWPWPATGWW